MASIQSLGIGSGLLTTDLVDNIISAERAGTDLRLDNKRNELSAKISALGTVKSSLTELRTAAFQVNVSSAYTGTAASATGSGVAATTTAAATPANHSVEISQLARAHTLASQRYSDPSSDVGTGTLSIRFGTTSYVSDSYDSFAVSAESSQLDLTIDSSNNSLTGIRDAINAAQAGVSASIVNDGVGYRLVLASQATGEENSLEIVVTEGAEPGLSALAYNSAANDPVNNMEETVRATDALAEIDGIAIRRSSNSIAEVVAGVTFELTAVNSGSPSVVTISRDTDDLVEKMEGFLEKYNGLRTLVDDLAGYNSDEKLGGLLLGDSALRTVMTQLRRTLTDVVEELGTGERRSLAEIGIRSDQNNDFALTLDKDLFLDAIASSPTAASGLFVDSGFASDSLITYKSDFPETKPGNYAVVIDQLATRGFLEGTGGQAGPFVVDADNNNLTLSINGVASGNLAFAEGSYASGDELAAEFQRQINADSALIAAGEAVTVSFETAANAFRITSNDYGSDSIVAITAIDTNTAAAFGLALADGESSRGQDVAGSINGVQAVGDGRNLTLLSAEAVAAIPAGPDTPATSGFYQGTESAFASGPVTITNGNRNVQNITVDGVASGNIRMTKATYNTGAELAANLQTRINADGNLQAAGKSVTVSFNALDNTFLFTSDSTGSGSSVEFTNVPANTEAVLGTTEGAGPTGTDLIPGTPEVPAIPAVDAEGNDAYGLSLEILGGSIGERGSLTLTNGVISQFVTVLNSALAFDGLLNDRIGGLEGQLDNVESDADDFDRRITLTEARLKSQFALADALIAQLNTTSDFITQQFASLTNANNNNK